MRQRNDAVLQPPLLLKALSKSTDEGVRLEMAAVAASRSSLSSSHSSTCGTTCSATASSASCQPRSAAPASSCS